MSGGMEGAGAMGLQGPGWALKIPLPSHPLGSVEGTRQKAAAGLRERPAALGQAAQASLFSNQVEDFWPSWSTPATVPATRPRAPAEPFRNPGNKRIAALSGGRNTWAHREFGDSESSGPWTREGGNVVEEKRVPLPQTAPETREAVWTLEKWHRVTSRRAAP